MKFGKIPKEKRKFICDKLIPEPYLSRTCSVPTPYILRLEVPLSEESTELVRSKCGSDTVRVWQKGILNYLQVVSKLLRSKCPTTYG